MRSLVVCTLLCLLAATVCPGNTRQLNDAKTGAICMLLSDSGSELGARDVTRFYAMLVERCTDHRAEWLPSAAACSVMMVSADLNCRRQHRTKDLVPGHIAS